MNGCQWILKSQMIPFLMGFFGTASAIPRFLRVSKISIPRMIPSRVQILVTPIDLDLDSDEFKALDDDFFQSVQGVLKSR